MLTVSDGVFAGLRPDTSGRLLRSLLEGIGARVELDRVVPDDRARIEAALVEACDELGLDLVMSTGGTGFGPRDVTPEATLAVVQRLAPGLAEAMRLAGLKQTRAAMLSRAVAGIRGRTLIVNLPGSPRGVQESFEAIADQIPHAVALLRGELGLHEPAGRA